MSKEIYTIGSANRLAEEFFNLLKTYQADFLVDIRRYPTSQLRDCFRKENLSLLAQQHQINYLWLGEYLGGFRPEGYLKFMETPLFKEGLRKLEELVFQGRVFLMCAEKLPWRCHRALLGWRLNRKGWKVIHVLDQENIWLGPTFKKQPEDLYWKIYNLVSKIPPGRVATYKTIAWSAKIKNPRLVGYFLSQNPFLKLVPCHRVVRSDGQVGGYQKGKLKKITLLKKEGLKIVEGKILDFNKVVVRRL